MGARCCCNPLQKWQTRRWAVSGNPVHQRCGSIPATRVVTKMDTGLFPKDFSASINPTADHRPASMGGLSKEAVGIDLVSDPAGRLAIHTPQQQSGRDGGQRVAQPRSESAWHDCDDAAALDASIAPHWQHELTAGPTVKSGDLAVSNTVTMEPNPCSASSNPTVGTQGGPQRLHGRQVLYPRLDGLHRNSNTTHAQLLVGRARRGPGRQAFGPACSSPERGPRPRALHPAHIFTHHWRLTTSSPDLDREFGASSMRPLSLPGASALGESIKELAQIWAARPRLS